MELDLKEMLKILRRQWWILLLVPLLATVAGYGITNQRSPVYETTTTLRIYPTNSGDDSLNYNAIVGTQSLVETYRRLIISRPMLANVIDELHLPYSVDDLRQRVTSSSVQNTQLFMVTVSDANPEVASMIAGGLSDEFISQLPKSGLSAEVVEAAPIPTIPVSPQPAIAALLALAAGIMVAIVLAALREYFDESVRPTSDFAKLTGAQLVSSLERIPLFLRRHRLPLPIRESPQSRGAEAIRILRANVELAMKTQGTKAIMIASPGHNEGRSTVAANLAFALAEVDISTVLVDADFRHPSLHSRFNIGNTTGLAALLPDMGTPLDAAGMTRIERNLRLVPAGDAGRNLPAMLTVDRLRARIDELGQNAEIVIVDTPPYLNRSDAFIVAASVDEAILVCDVGRTKQKALSTTATSLSQGGVPILGVVLNRPLPSWHPRRWFEALALQRDETTPPADIRTYRAPKGGSQTPTGRDVSQPILPVIVGKSARR